MDLGVPDLLRRAKLMRQIHFSRVFPCGASAALFSAMALEAHPHDLGLFLDQFLRPEDPPQLHAVRNIIPQLEEDRVQLKSKISIIYYLLKGAEIPKGGESYQDFSLLIDIRNQIAHFKPTVSEYFPDRMDRPARLVKLLQRISQRRIIDRDLVNEPGSLPSTWTMVLDESDRFTDWAIDVAYATIRMIYDAIPDCECKIRYLSGVLPSLSKDQIY